MKSKSKLSPKERLFYDEMICSQGSKPKSGLIQILVQNYLEHQYNSENVFMYPEIINENLEDRGAVIDGVIDSSIEVCAFLKDYISVDSYLSSYEVKTGENKYITKFKNLKQILTKIQYQPKTKLVLVLVPNIDENFSELSKNVKIFNSIKSKISSMNENNKYKLFNEIVLNEEFNESSITSALSIMINLVKDGKSIIDKLKKEKKNECITNEQFNILYNQFNQLKIEILTIDDLAKYDINREFIFRIIELLS